jgi:hypothetical protein
MAKIDKEPAALSINKNEYFIKAGISRTNWLHFKRNVRVILFIQSGDENTLVFGMKETAFCLQCLFRKDRFKTLFSALEDAFCCIIPFKDWTELLSGHPCWRAIYARYLQILFFEKENRETEFLCNDAGTRYLTFVNKYPQIAKRVPHYHIASYSVSPRGLKPDAQKSEIDLGQ